MKNYRITPRIVSSESGIDESEITSFFGLSKKEFIKKIRNEQGISFKESKEIFEYFESIQNIDISYHDDELDTLKVKIDLYPEVYTKAVENVLNRFPIINNLRLLRNKFGLGYKETKDIVLFVSVFSDDALKSVLKPIS